MYIKWLNEISFMLFFLIIGIFLLFKNLDFLLIFRHQTLNCKLFFLKFIKLLLNIRLEIDQHLILFFNIESMLFTIFTIHFIILLKMTKINIQQHFFFFSLFWFAFIIKLSVFSGCYFWLTNLARVIKTSSTLVPLFTEVKI